MKRKRAKKTIGPKDLIPVSGNLPVKAVEPLEPFSLADALPLIPGAPKADLEFSFWQQQRYIDVLTKKNKDLQAGIMKSVEEILNTFLYLKSRLEGQEESKEKLKYRVLRLKAVLEKQALLLNEVFTASDEISPALAQLILEAEKKRKGRGDE